MTTQVPESMLDIDGLLDAVVPLGACIPYYGTAAPNSRWLFPYGQAISRATYAALFTLIGTTHGVGDGATTFNLPDHRGRVAVGKDNMGGVPANRVTVAVSGVDAATLGAVGGSQSLQQHNHVLTDPGHTHTTTSGVETGNAGVNSQAVGGTANTGSSTTGITLADTGTGDAQNVQPSIVGNFVMRVI